MQMIRKTQESVINQLKLFEDLKKQQVQQLILEKTFVLPIKYQRN